MKNDLTELSGDLLEIQNWLKTVKFKKKLFGGVDEVEVWKKIEELNSLYERVLIAERARLGDSAEEEQADE